MYKSTGKRDRCLLQLAKLAVFMALFVIALGAFTRLLDAGLGCPDWPGCYGNIVAPLTSEKISLLHKKFPAVIYVGYKAWAEMTHRYAVSILSILILIISCRVLFYKISRTRSNVVLVLGLLSLLVYQVLLGMWTVTERLWPVIVTQHLIGGFLILVFLWLIFCNCFPKIKESKVPKLVIFFSIVVLSFLIVQILLGAWTSTNYASLSCPDFPFCLNDQSIKFKFIEAFHLMSTGIDFQNGVMPIELKRTIQMTHRVGALILSICLLSLTTVILVRPLPSLAKYAYIILLLLPIQICLGIFNVLFHLPIFTAVCHNLVAALLLLTMVSIVRRALH